MNIIFNKEMFALPRRLLAGSGTIAYDLFEAFGTQYGLFLPVSSSGHHFIRWVRRGMRDILPVNCVYVYMLHISNDGEVMVVTADQEGDSIVMLPYTVKEFCTMSIDRELTEAYTHLIRNCKTIQEAIQIVDEADARGLFDPNIFFVSDWVNYAKEKGYTDLFYHIKFSKLDM